MGTADRNEELRDLIKLSQCHPAATEKLFRMFLAPVTDAVRMLEHLAQSGDDLEKAMRYITANLWARMEDIGNAENPWSTAMGVIANSRVRFAFQLCGTEHA